MASTSHSWLDRLLRAASLAIPLGLGWDLAASGVYGGTTLLVVGGGALGLWWATRLPFGVKGAMLACGAAAALALLVGEVVLQRWLTPPTSAQVAARQGLDFDKRTRAQVVRELRAQGENALPAYSAAVVGRRMGGEWLDCAAGRLQPLAGVARVTTVSCNESGQYAIYQSDEHGFRNPHGSHALSPEVVLLGDSFVQGSCVPPGQELAAHLRRQGMTTLGLGLQGAGPLLELAVLREYAAPLRPRRVVWAFFNNDLRNLADEWRAPALLRYLTDPNHSQRLRERQPELDQGLSADILQRLQSLDEPMAPGPPEGLGVLTQAFKLTRVRELGQRLLGGRDPHHRSQLPRFQEVLAQAQREVTAWGGTLHFVYLPDYREVEPGQHGLEELVTGAASRAGALPLPVREVFTRQPDPHALFALGIPNHYSAEGYRQVAERIAQGLQAH